jgi:hypothetical protein
MEPVQEQALFLRLPSASRMAKDQGFTEAKREKRKVQRPPTRPKK